ncbi:MAG: hypothetical protein ACRD1J_00800 [Terriglobia bacterium]
MRLQQRHGPGGGPHGATIDQGIDLALNLHLNSLTGSGYPPRVGRFGCSRKSSEDRRTMTGDGARRRAHLEPYNLRGRGKGVESGVSAPE